MAANESNRPPFEQELIPLEEEIRQLEESPNDENARNQCEQLRQKHRARLSEIYATLNPWDIVNRVARHAKRPQSTDYLRRICSDFCQLHGDRSFGDDPAILTGFARIGKFKVMVVAHRKGRDTNERMLCNFGCAHPEGYRKALKNMKLAEKFGLPVVTLVDTPGAYPGLGAEERGQAEAIAVNLREMSRLRTPILSIIIGEGGSGGALGIAVADRVGMLRYSWYSVISPEGCAAILWKESNPKTNEEAAHALALTAVANLKLGTIDDIIEEPVGGAHRDHDAAAESVQRWIIEKITELKRFKIENLVQRRYDRYRRVGAYSTADAG